MQRWAGSAVPRLAAAQHSPRAGTQSPAAGGAPVSRILGSEEGPRRASALSYE
jgi:hypothetical protein